MRLKPNQGYFSVQFLSRTGNIRDDFKARMELSGQELYSTVLFGELTIEVLDQIIQQFMELLQEFAQINDRVPIKFNQE